MSKKAYLAKIDKWAWREWYLQNVSSTFHGPVTNDDFYEVRVVGEFYDKRDKEKFVRVKSPKIYCVLPKRFII